MPQNSLPDKPFQHFSDVVVTHLMKQRLSLLLDRAGVVLFPLLACMGILFWLLNLGWFSLLLSSGIILCWLLVSFFSVWKNRPSALASLAQWDRTTNQNEQFHSALQFEQLSKRNLFQQLHLKQSLEELPAQKPLLQKLLPVSFSYRLWLFPVLFLSVSLLFQWKSPLSSHSGLSSLQTKVLSLAALKLDQAEQEIFPTDFASLSEEEVQRLKQLRKSLKTRAEEFRHLEGLSKEELLSALEQQAQEAENLAESIAASQQQLSTELIAALKQQTETSPFGGALESNQLRSISTEAKSIADRLNRSDLTFEEKRRFQQGLTTSMQSAKDTDLQTLIGADLHKAEALARTDRFQEAAKEFQEISSRADRDWQRMLTQQKLKELANQLRQSGFELTSQPKSKEHLTVQNKSSLRQLSDLNTNQKSLSDLDQLLTPKEIKRDLPQGHSPDASSQPPAGTPPSKPLAPPPPVPGVTEKRIPGAGRRLTQTPVPGTVPVPAQSPIPGQSAPDSHNRTDQQSGNLPKNAPPIPGTTPERNGNQNAPPIPGTSSTRTLSNNATPKPTSTQSDADDRAQQKSLFAAAQGNASSPNGAGAGQSGMKPGTGTIPNASNTTTKRIESTTQETVFTEIAGEGDSEMKQLERTSRQESKKHSARDLVRNVISSEEQALEIEKIPLTRRTQIQRYFRALRSQLSE